MSRNTSRPISLFTVAGMVIAQLFVTGPAMWGGEVSAAPPSPTSWTRYAGNPLVLREGGNSLFGASLVDTGDEFFFYYACGVGGLATSKDCKSWTKYAGGTVWSSGCLPSMMKDGSVWKMWFTNSNGVGYATSNDGKSWTTMATGVMPYGGSGSWDNQIWRVNVVKDTNGYKMYYEGHGQYGRIGLATSPDETHWTKYSGNPIITAGPGGSFDSRDVQFPCVLKLSNEYSMWYTGHDGSRVAIGYANSTDGVSWTKYAGNPVLGYNNGWDYSCTMPNVVLRNNTLEMMYTGITSSWQYEAGLAESFGSTPSSPTPLSPQNDQWTNDSTPTFSWSFGTPSEQTAFQFQLAEAGDFSSTSYDSGKQATDRTTFTILSPLADGIHYWRVKSWDLGNVASGWSTAWKLKVDSTPPLNPTGLASTSHASGVWSRDNTVTAGWTLPPGGGDMSGYAGFGTLWDTSPSSIPNLMDLQDPVATVSESQPAADTAGLYFHIRSCDRAGNWAAGAAHLGPFSIDASPPFNPANLSSPSHAPREWCSDNTVDMIWDEPEAGLSGAEGYAYIWDRQPHTLPQTILNISADVMAISSEQLMDGNDWYFHLRTKDRAGNWALSGAHRGPYWIDATPPKVLEVTVNGGALYATCQTARAILRVEDPAGGSGLSGMRWKLNEGGWSDWEKYANSTFLDLSRGDGAYSIQVQVRDLANNTSPAASAAIQLDRIPPPGAEITLNEGARFTNSTAVVARVSAQDPAPGSGISNMSFSFDGKNWDPWMPFCESCALGLPSGDGNKTVQLRLRDNAGNAGPAAVATIALDTIPPVSFVPMLKDVVDDLSFDVNWTAADATSGVATFDVQYQDGNGTWTDWFTGTCQTGARFTGQDNHTYRFRVLARDNAANRELTFKAVSNPVKIELPPPLVSISKPAPGTVVRGMYTASGVSGHPRNDRSVVRVEVCIDDGPWKAARGTTAWSYSIDSNRLDNGKHTLMVRSFDGTRYSTEAVAEFEVKNEKGLSLEGLPLLGILLIAVLVVAGIGTGLYLSRRKDGAPPPPAQAATDRQPALPVIAVSPMRPAEPPVPAQPPGTAPSATAPAALVERSPVPSPGATVVEKAVSVDDLDREMGEATSPAATGLPPPEDAPEAPKKPRTVEDEQARRESRVLQALSSLPRGLPSTLWGIDMEDLAARVVAAERKDTPGGDLLVKVSNRWYYGDETNLGLFMQEYKG